MKKKFYCLGIFLMCLILVTGCHKKTATEYLWSVSTGDTVSVKLDTSSGYEMTSELPFEISKDNKIYANGEFLTKEGYDTYIEYTNDSSLVLKDTNDYIEYSIYDFGTEDEPDFRAAIYINNSETGVLISDTVSLDSLKEILNLLTIKLSK